MTDSTVQLDVLVLGGGIAGLWTLHTLRQRGYAAALLTRGPLGAGQTVASQGIIHGGLKYLLPGSDPALTAVIARMPDAWRAALNRPPLTTNAPADPLPEALTIPDLSSATLLSDEQFFFTTGSLGSWLAGLSVRTLVRTRVRRVPHDDLPLGLRAPASAPSRERFDVYAVDEPVVDPCSVVAAFARQLAGSILQHEPDHEPDIAREPDAFIVTLPHDPSTLRLRARAVVLAAGNSNDALAARFGIPSPDHIIQRRPLHMVLARTDEPGPAQHPEDPRLPLLFAHALGPSKTPRATITSTLDAHGRLVWYIGGAIAESGVHRARDGQIDHARAELAACFPWRNFDACRFATLRIDRAEAPVSAPLAAADNAGRAADEPPSARTRPGDAAVLVRGRVLIIYPTKLALAPVLAARTAAAIHQLGIHPAPDNPRSPRVAHIPSLTPPATATPPPCREDLQWT